MAIRKSPFKLCTFDVTNTLLKFHVSVGEQYSSIGRLYGVDRDADQITASFRHQWKVMSVNHPNFGQKSGLTSRQWWREIVRRTFSVGHFTLGGNQLNLISNHLYEIYATEKCWKVVSGTEDILKLLNDNGIIVGVISNFDERLDSVLQSTGLKPYFSFVLASFLVGHAKPNPKIFDIALEQNSGIAGSSALHIGDDVKLDYIAAKEAGWKSLLIKHNELTLEHSKYIEPNDIVHDINQIEGRIFCS